ncbi:hypothetical protein WG901_19570 [Novosphingobium sp. PS1R-30]|uniref:Uncharacterized protein n=1 Tax=Novosphingobium anseongense TaxID=3133436 RepID=A0ABU8S1L9_9SPHN
MDYQELVAGGGEETTPENEISLKVAELVTKIIVSGSMPGVVAGRDPDAAIDGVLMALALVLEQSPEGATPRDLRKQCEQFGKQLHYHAKLFRGVYEKTGQHPIEQLLGDFASPIAKTAH